MAVIRSKPWANIAGQQLRNFSITEQLNGAVTWSAELSGRYDDTFTGVLTIGDGLGYVYTSPPLVAKTGARYSSVTKSTVLSGLDLWSWMLSQPNQSLPTFRNTTAQVIVKAISTASGVPIEATDLNFNIAEEDIKQSNWFDPVLRYCEVACKNTIIKPQGIVAVPFRWTAETIDFRVSDTCEENINSARDITGFVVNKRTSQYQEAEVSRYYTFDSPGYKVVALRAPVELARAVDRSTLGACTLIGFWNGPPNVGTSKLLGFQSMGDADGAYLTTPIGGTGPATHMTLSVKEPSDPNLAALGIAAKVEVLGSTPKTVPGADQIDLDLGFTATVGVITGPNARPGPVRNEPLYPSASWVTAHEQELLWEANKGNHSMNFGGSVDCGVRLGCRVRPLVEDTYPDSKIYTFTHSGDRSGFRTRIGSYKIPW